MAVSRAACCIEACARRRRRRSAARASGCSPRTAASARCLRRRGGVVPRPSASTRDRGDGKAGREARLCAHRLLLLRARGRTGRATGRPRARRTGLCLFRQRRIGSDRGAIKIARQYFIEGGAAAAPALHRAAAELSRQHARRAGGRRQCLAARALSAAAVAGLQPCHAGLRLSREARRRIRGGFCRAARRRTRSRIPAARPRHGRGVHRRARRRRDRRRGAPRRTATSARCATSATGMARC